MERRAKGRMAVWLAGLGVLGLFAFAATSWKELATRYHGYRLRSDASYLPEVLGAPPSSPRHVALVDYSRTEAGASAILRAFLEDETKAWLQAGGGPGQQAALLNAPDQVQYLLLGVCRQGENVSYWYSWDDGMKSGVVSASADALLRYQALELLRGKQLSLPEHSSFDFQVVTSEEALRLPLGKHLARAYLGVPTGACPLVCLASRRKLYWVPKWVRRLGEDRP